MRLLVGHPEIALIGLIVALAVAWWAYRRTTPTLTPGLRWTLTALRAVTLALVLFLLAQPLLRRTTVEEQPASVALLLDDSRSVALADSLTGGRLDSLLAAFGDALPDGVRPIRIAFDASPRRLADGDTLFRTGDRTDIGRALTYPREMLREANVQAAVLVTDGRYTAGRNPVYVADDVRVPLFAAAVGDTTAQRDVRITRLDAAELLYLGAESAARVTVAADGVDAQTPLTVTLQLGGRTVATERIASPAAGSRVSVDLPFTPTVLGPTRLTAIVSRVDGEATYRNNSRSLAADVRDDRRSVLLVAGAPEPDVSAVRAALASDAGLTLTTRIQKEPGAFYEGPLPARLDTFDAFVLVGFPSEAASTADLQRLLAAATGGVGLATFATARTDLGNLRTLAPLLPATPSSAASDAVEVLPAVTAAGRAHPILTLPDVAPIADLGLPPLRYPVARWQPEAGATVLATTNERGVTLNNPMMAARRVGRARSFVLVGGGVWRWRTLPEALAQSDAFWPAFVANVVRWVSADEDGQALRIRPTESVFGAGEPVVLQGTLYDESRQPVTGAQISVDVATPGGETLPLTLQSLGAGRYGLDAGTLPEGTYRFSATATREGAEIGEDAGSFVVGPVDAEFADVTADLPLLQQVAARTGGRAVPLDQLPALAAELAPLLQPTLVPTTIDDPLWDAWPLLVLIVLLLTAEWVMRKRAGLV